jgi:hypothetical protein
MCNRLWKNEHREGKRGGEEEKRTRVYTAGARHYSHYFISIETTFVVKELHSIDDE